MVSGEVEGAAQDQLTLPEASQGCSMDIMKNVQCSDEYEGFNLL